jgi:predicted S18 family serine protease
MNTSTQDINDLKEYLNDHIVAINIVDLVKYYETRISELEDQLREAHLNNAEKLFRDFNDE